MRHSTILVAAVGSLALAACSPPANDKAAAEKAPAAALGHTAEQTRNLATFDDLDFNVYSGRSGTSSVAATPRTSWSTILTARPPRACPPIWTC